jgi:hypothetical protein
MLSIASLVQDDPYLKMPKEERIILRRHRRARLRTFSPPSPPEPVFRFEIPNPPLGVRKIKAVRREYQAKHSFSPNAGIGRRIMIAVSREFDMTVPEMIEQNNHARYVLPRFVVIGLMLELTQMSLATIGRYLNGRDHSTIYNGRKRLNKLLESEAFRNRFDQLKAEIMA